MNLISVHSQSGYQHGMGAFGNARVEHEHCPPIAMVFFVFAAAMTGGIWFADRFNDIAIGWMAGVAILGMMGLVIDRWFSGADALERRIRHRQRARSHALGNLASTRDLTRQWRAWNASATREWTSTSAYRRHPQPMTTARADWSPDSTRPGIRAEYRMRRA